MNCRALQLSWLSAGEQAQAPVGPGVERQAAPRARARAQPFGLAAGPWGNSRRARSRARTPGEPWRRPTCSAVGAARSWQAEPAPQATALWDSDVPACPGGRELRPARRAAAITVNCRHDTTSNTPSAQRYPSRVNWEAPSAWPPDPQQIAPGASSSVRRQAAHATVQVQPNSPSPPPAHLPSLNPTATHPTASCGERRA